MHKIQMLLLFNCNSLEKISIGWKKNVPIKCLLPLFGGSERDELSKKVLDLEKLRCRFSNPKSFKNHF